MLKLVRPGGGLRPSPRLLTEHAPFEQVPEPTPSRWVTTWGKDGEDIRNQLNYQRVTRDRTGELVKLKTKDGDFRGRVIGYCKGDEGPHLALRARPPTRIGGGARALPPHEQSLRIRSSLWHQAGAAWYIIARTGRGAAALRAAWLPETTWSNQQGGGFIVENIDEPARCVALQRPPGTRSRSCTRRCFVVLVAVLRARVGLFVPN